MESLVGFLKSLERAGYGLNTVYDVGACAGTWSKDLARHFPAAQMILFEANPAYAGVLENTGFRHFNVVLSSPDRKSVDFYNGTNTGDSYYKETTRFYDQQGSIALPCTTLDRLISAHSLPLPNFLKLDTQGSELDILEGFGNLDRVELVLVECPIIRYNHGAPTMDDYLDYFKARKFIPVDVLEVHRIENTLLQIDIMFVREDIKYRYFGQNIAIRPFA